MSWPRRIPACLVLGFLACSLAAPARGQSTIGNLLGRAPLGRSVPAGTPVGQAIQTLHLLRDPEAPAIEVLAERVDENNHEVLTELLRDLEERRLPALEDEPPQALSVFQEQLILEVFARAGRTQVHTLIELRGTVEGEGLSAGVVGALGAVGGSRDLRDLLENVMPTGADELDPAVADALEGALAGICERESDSFSALSVLVHSADPGLLPVIVKAAGRTGDPRCVELLADSLGRREDIASLVCGQVCMVGPSRSLEVNRYLADALRPLLIDGTPTLQRSAIMALAELEDYYSLPMLIEMLELEDEGLRDTALWSLRHLTGLKYGIEPSRWEAWYAEELEWSGLGRQTARLRLNSSNPKHAAEAIREYSRHRLHRHELALDVEGVLQRSQTSLRIAACETLAQLGSVYSMPALVDLMADPRLALKQAANNALGRISGRQLPADHGVWVALLETDN